MLVLNREILSILVKKTRRTENTIRKDISLLRRKYSRLPINSVAQIYALENETSVIRKLTQAERDAVPILAIEKPIRIMQKPKNSKNKNLIKPFVKYETSDTFIAAHLNEVNKCYTYGCYTAAFVLCRKIIENLLTDIIRSKYPHNKKENIDLYFDTARGRTRDFSEIIINLKQHVIDFGPDKKLLERILSKAIEFKDDANDKAHSWYHLVSKAELESTEIQLILNMIKKLETNLQI